ncbi:ABC transporter substrate-binding protein [Tsuneonella sp. CC-YZS046]|uniref:ABC transporter substrate-binding protein n=1 Tax=Tsuneonella sp. CC-YZS046 TaxID=3042152 RepID=UPI002D7693CF|nr:ABC transporter substrate-binding protein [Tsuneonella sp. CC-YZS046]WRO68024.1 ABC transporter substrate-binding protein [Tsuneonella sp. CC-YZS046]
MRALLAAALAALAGCTGPGPAEQPREHPTIVSLNPCSDAILADVVDPSQILAISHYSHDPRSSSIDLRVARRFPATGGTVEEILALKPDVVVAGTFMPSATRIALERFGIRVESFAIEHDVPESIEQIRGLARLTGHPERGERLVQGIERALARAAPAASSPAIPAVVWQSGGIVPGPDALISDIMRRTGFSSHSAARGLRQADYLPLEEMLADPPRLILAAGDSSTGEDRMLQHPALESLADTRRHVLDPSLIFCGGPTIIRAAERLREIRQAMATGGTQAEVAG